MSDRVEIVTVDLTNVDERGFFCYKSKQVGRIQAETELAQSAPGRREFLELLEKE